MKHHAHDREWREGLVVVDLRVVIAILAVLAGLLLPSLDEAKTELNGFAFLKDGRFEMANAAGPTVVGQNALSTHLSLSAPSTCS